MECTLEDLQGLQVTEMDIYMRVSFLSQKCVPFLYLQQGQEARPCFNLYAGALESDSANIVSRAYGTFLLRPDDLFILVPQSPNFCDGVPPLEGYDENKWLAISVRFDSTEKYRMRGPDGKLLSSCIDKRGHVLKFVRQLPRFNKVPTDELESPWYIVNV